MFCVFFLLLFPLSWCETLCPNCIILNMLTSKHFCWLSNSPVCIFELKSVFLCHSSMESRNRSHSQLHMLHHNAVLCQNMLLYQLLICFMELEHSVHLLHSSHRSVLPVCCVVSFLLSLNATYFKHASTSCSSTKNKANNKNDNPFSASTVSLWCTPRLHGRLMFKD